MFIQNSGEVPKAAASRNAMLAEIPALPFSTRRLSAMHSGNDVDAS